MLTDLFDVCKLTYNARLQTQLCLELIIGIWSIFVVVLDFLEKKIDRTLFQRNFEFFFVEIRIICGTHFMPADGDHKRLFCRSRKLITRICKINLIGHPHPHEQTLFCLKKLCDLSLKSFFPSNSQNNTVVCWRVNRCSSELVLCKNCFFLSEMNG